MTKILAFIDRVVVDLRQLVPRLAEAESSARAAGRRGIGAWTVTLHVRQLEAGHQSPVDAGFEVVYSRAAKASTM
jgi:hypothetical protein